MGDWCTIESDPGVFSELINGIGVKGVQVDELYSLDDEHLLASVKPIYGLVFLFKWEKTIEKRECLTVYDSSLFFANQVITNACATQALLSILLNRDDAIDIGEDLKNFKAFTETMDPYSRGLTLSNQPNIKRVHNSFARPEPFEFLEQPPKKNAKGDAFHFVSFVPFKGQLYELDGLQPGPILIGSYENDDWLPLATQEINQRILKYSESEVRFNLLALTKDKRFECKRLIKESQIEKFALYQKARLTNLELNGMLEADFSEIEVLLTESEKLAATQSTLEGQEILSRLAIINGEIEQHSFLLADEEDKFKKYQSENVRRRHNYIPFILELFRQLAQKNKLPALVENAKNKKKEKLSQQKQTQK